LKSICLISLLLFCISFPLSLSFSFLFKRIVLLSPSCSF
jgi:hypothetical protein